MDCFHLVECAITILSHENNALDVQSASIVVIDASTKKKCSRSPFVSVGTMSEVEDDSFL